MYLDELYSMFLTIPTSDESRYRCRPCITAGLIVVDLITIFLLYQLRLEEMPTGHGHESLKNWHPRPTCH